MYTEHKGVACDRTVSCAPSKHLGSSKSACGHCDKLVSVTPPWVEALPWLLRAPTQYLYVDTLLPSDDFLTQLRKLFFAVAVLMAMGPVSLTVLNALTLPADQPLFAKTFASLHCVVLPFYWVTIYVLSRRGCVSTRTLAMWWIYGSAVPAFMTTISTPDFPIQETFILLFIIAQLLRAPMLPLLAAVFAVGHLIASHNAAAYHRGEPDVPLVAIPGVAMREYPYRIALVAMSFSVVAVVMAALRFQLSESDRQTTQATATSELALAIAQRLGEYDTAGAHALLDGAASMDSSLHDAMKVLIDNLDKYRPHLPNWVVGDAEDSTEQHPMRRTSDAASTSHMETTETSAAPERSVRSSGRSSGGTAPLTAIIHGDAGWFRGGQAFESFASFALIKFYVCDGEPFSAASSASMTSFVDTVHRLASQTSGAVHSFVGDTLSLSWNAASRAVQSESKAVRMVARLKKAADSTCWRITGAVQSGKMCVQLAGGVESRQQALTLTSPWVSANLAPLLVTAAQRGLAMVTDHRTRVGAAHAASFRPTAAVQQPGARLGIFELLCENGADSDADEWIYVLARQQQAERDGMLQSTIDVTDALELWVKGDDDAAAAKLGIANSDGREWSATVAAAINARCK